MNSRSGNVATDGRARLSPLSMPLTTQLLLPIWPSSIRNSGSNNFHQGRHHCSGCCLELEFPSPNQDWAVEIAPDVNGPTRCAEREDPARGGHSNTPTC